MHNTLSVEKIEYHPDSSFYFLKLKPLEKRVWLDSGKPKSNYGRFDILTACPIEILINPTAAQIESAIEALKLANENDTSDIELPFRGGAIGYFNYDYNHDALGIPKNSQSEPASDIKSVVGIFDWAIVQDHEQRKSYFLHLSNCSDEKLKHIRNLLDEAAPPISSFCVENLKNDIEKQHYLDALDEIHRYIVEGDSYQINFSQRFSGKINGDIDAAYLTLRNTLPSPYSAFLELAEDSILCLSPERFISLENDYAITQPIKGTAPRGNTIEEDAALANELINSDKNRAENLMIVDLLRNDFSKSCEPHTVKTNALFSLESFANVHHLVSTITGKLRDDVTPLSFFLDCFPGGSITGAPKKRSMEIIQELEQHPRNIYCGSVFYLSADGKLNSNIAIRTLRVADNQIYCWAGGGIVFDSKNEDEYQETLEKVGILLKALTETARP